MQFLSSIEIHPLKVTEIVFSKYERGNWRKKREQILVSKVEFKFQICSGIKAIPINPVFSN